MASGQPTVPQSGSSLPQVTVQGRNRRPAQRVFTLANETDLQGLVGGLHRMLQAAGVHTVDAARIVTAASELAHNVLRYGVRGHLTVRVGEINARGVVELVAQDSGPGIADLALVMGDHYTTGGGLGLGLPGVQRLMDVLAIDTALGSGTRVVARRWL